MLHVEGRPLAELQNLKVFQSSSASKVLPLFLSLSLPSFIRLLLSSPTHPLGWLNCPDYLLSHFTFRKSRTELARRPVGGGSTYRPAPTLLELLLLPLPPPFPPPSPFAWYWPAAVLLLNLQLHGLCRTGSVKELS